MNVKGSEFSIFQGGPSIHVDNNQQRIEEEEALQDQIRRHAELNHELQNAFDDLDEEDVNETLNSTKFSHQQSHHQNRDKNNSLNMNNQRNYHQDFNLRDGETQLKNMLESKNREIDYITNQLSMERKQNKSTIDEFEKRLAIAEAEKERAIMTRDQTHELLVENKGKVIEMQETNDKLHSKIKSVEKENSMLVGELESTKYMLQDIQLKYNMVEKNVIISADKNTDKILKQAQERHNAQTAMMQQQVESIQSKFDDLEHEFKNLDIRYKELQRSRESMLIEKSETINQLTKNLEDSQRQCQELLSRPNLNQENRYLQNIVRALESEKEDLNRTVNRLQKKINDQQQEMEMMDSVVQECGGNNMSFSESMKFINREPLKNSNSSTPLAPETRLMKVKEELCKSLNNIKNKREELKICERQLAEKDKEIKQLKMDENKALSQMNHFRDEAIRFENKTKILEKELDEMRIELRNIRTCSKDETIDKEMKKLLTEKNNLEVQLNNLKMDYEKLNMKNDELMEAEREWKKIALELEVMQNSSKITEECEKEKGKVQKPNDEWRKMSMVEKVDRETQKDNNQESLEKSSTCALLTNGESCQKCDEYLLKFEKLELSCLQLQNSNAEHLTCLRETRRQLDEANRIIHGLEEKLDLKRLRDEEIEKLSQKAREFEEFMKNQTTKCGSFDSSKASTSTPSSSTDAATETSGILVEDENIINAKVREIETRTRDEMARLYAHETKMWEKKYSHEFEKMKNKIVSLTRELDETNEELSVRREQLEMLKFTILQERESSKKLLHERDIELGNCHQKLEEIASKRQERDEILEVERESVETLKKHYQEELEQLRSREKDYKRELQEIQVETAKTIEELKEKYFAMKRTATNYKKYSEDKENYYKKESQRIAEKYKENAEKLRNNFEKYMKEKIENLETMYEIKINKIQGEHEIQLDTLKKLLK